MNQISNILNDSNDVLVCIRRLINRIFDNGSAVKNIRKHNVFAATEGPG